MANQPTPCGAGSSPAAPAELLAQINASISFDKQLYRQDIRGSIAHAGMLAKQKIIDRRQMPRRDYRWLKSHFKKKSKPGKFTFKESLEDIHMNIESALRNKIGPRAGKLHTARCRNDQVATDFRVVSKRREWMRWKNCAGNFAAVH